MATDVLHPTRPAPKKDKDKPKRAWLLKGNEDPISGEPPPYIEVRDGLWALINRAVYYELAERVIPSPNTPGQWGVFSEGCFFRLGSLNASDRT